MKIGATPGEKVLAGLILCDGEGRQGDICSGLVQNFKEGSCHFNVKHADGSVFRVTIKQEEITPAEEACLVTPQPTPQD